MIFCVQIVFISVRYNSCNRIMNKTEKHKRHVGSVMNYRKKNASICLVFLVIDPHNTHFVICSWPAFPPQPKWQNELQSGVGNVDVPGFNMCFHDRRTEIVGDLHINENNVVLNNQTLETLRYRVTLHWQGPCHDNQNSTGHILTAPSSSTTSIPWEKPGWIWFLSWKITQVNCFWLSWKVEAIVKTPIGTLHFLATFLKICINSS